MSEGHQRDREPRPKVTEVPADQANSFAILRRPQVDNDQIPEHAWPRFEGGRIRELGLNPALARRVVTALGEAWVIPGNGYVAMDVGGMTANRTEHAARRGMITWTSRAPDHQNLVHGLVPDGVDEVTLPAMAPRPRRSSPRTSTEQCWTARSGHIASSGRMGPSSSGSAEPSGRSHPARPGPPRVA